MPPVVVVPEEAAGVDVLPESLDVVAGAAVVPVVVLAAVLVVALLSAFAPPVLEPPRKSVTYQPVPFNWKPAAVTCFLNVACPHSGQSVRTGSDIFCKTSLLNPQDSQR